MAKRTIGGGGGGDGIREDWTLLLLNYFLFLWMISRV